MSGLVERLAAKRDDIPGGFAMSKYLSEKDRDEAEARWWINALADELEARACESPTKTGADGCRASARWLREQAGEP